MPLGFAIQGVASKLCFRDKSQLKWRFWRMGVCSERVEIIPNVWCGANFVEAHMRRYCHFSWQAQDFVRALKRGSAILVAGAGNREAARCEGGDISWLREMQARVRFVRCPHNPLRRSCASSARNASEHWRLCSTTLVRGVSGKLEDENW